MEKPYRIIVCRGEDCSEKGSEETYAAFQSLLRKSGLDKKAVLYRVSCFGKCAGGPNVVIGPRIADPDPIIGEAQYFSGLPGECLYCGVTGEKAARLLGEHLRHGRPVVDMLCGKTAGKGSGSEGD